jgi:hypothetical protein
LWANQPTSSKLVNAEEMKNGTVFAVPFLLKLPAAYQLILKIITQRKAA